ncbi:MAG: GntR family transcriptional regulator [Gaiella sp.]
MTSNGGSRPTAQKRAADALRSAILEGELRPGQRISQETWAERTGVSLIPLREALQGLAGEGLVAYRPRRGYAVTELDLAELADVYSLRKILETEAIERGVPDASDADVAVLAAAADRCRSTGRSDDVALRLSANREFHDALHGLARSRQLTRLIDQLWDATEAYRALYYTLPGEVARADSAHDEIVEAVRRRDKRRVVALQDEHRERALALLRTALPERAVA